MDKAERKPRAKSKEYPAVTLAAAISFVDNLKDYIPLKAPISYETAAKAQGVVPSTNSFRYTLSAARQYGLLSTSIGKSITFLEPAKRLTRPTEGEDALRALKLECFCAPKLNEEIISHFSGHSMPSATVLENVLVNQCGIVPSVAANAASIFLETANEVGAVQNGILNPEPSLVSPPGDENDEPDENSKENNDHSTSAKKQDSNTDLSTAGNFSPPLNIPFGDERRAVLHMPIEASKEDAVYVMEMITLMFKRVYGVTEEDIRGK